MKKTLTEKAVSAAKGGVTRQEIADTILPGLYLIVQPSGVKSWALRYRTHGRSRKMTLGKYPALKVSRAREKARTALEDVSNGRDPAAESKAQKAVRPQTFDDLREQYIERYSKLHKRAWKNDETAFRLHITPVWKHRPIDSITKGDVIALLDKYERQPALQYQLFALLRKTFAWALDKELVDTSPIVGLRLDATVPDRDRVLTDDEIRELWSAWEAVGWPWAHFHEILLLTGQRRTEVASMRWGDVQDDIWTIPASRTKARRAHVVPLSALAFDVLSEVPRQKSDFVFPAKSNPTAHISGYSKGKMRVDKKVRDARADAERLPAAKVKPIDWRLHDLRRTTTSGMARLGIQPHVLSAILNHAPASRMGITAIYNRWEYLPEKREALETWGQHIRQLISGAHVVRLREPEAV